MIFSVLIWLILLHTLLCSVLEGGELEKTETAEIVKK